jgi:uncharacterized protein (TIGR00251 family)
MPAPSCKIAIKAVPNAPRNAIAGWIGAALKVRVHAPALEGRANEELCAFLADALALPRRAVSVAHGDKSRQKVLQIDGMTLDAVRAKLGV